MSGFVMPSSDAREFDSDESTRSFNEDNVRKDWDDDYFLKLRQNHPRFRGDWYYLALLIEFLDTHALSNENPTNDDLYQREDAWGRQKNKHPLHAMPWPSKSTSFQVSQPSTVHLENADLRGRDLRGLDFRNDHLEGVDLAQARLDDCNLGHTHLERAEFYEASLCNARLIRTYLEGANLVEADLSGANLNGADLTRTDCRGAKGIIFDETRIDQVRLSAGADDPWSILRRKYTGPNLAMILLLTLVFFVPMIAKALLMTQLGAIQDIIESDARLLNEELSGLAPESDWIAHRINGFPKFRRIPVWTALLHIHRGWLHSIPVILLIFYNILGGYLTYSIGLLRNAESWSRVSPSKFDYLCPPREGGVRIGQRRIRPPRPWHVHKVCMYLSWLAFSWAIIVLGSWLWSAYVWLPEAWVGS